MNGTRRRWNGGFVTRACMLAVAGGALLAPAGAAAGQAGDGEVTFTRDVLPIL